MLEPSPLQVQAGDFLAARRAAYLCDDCGAGKTLSSVLGADRLGAKRILVLCPAIVKTFWAWTFRENQRVGRPVTVVDGSPKCRMVGPCGVTIISHAGIVRRDAVKLLQDWWDLLILDEAHEIRAISAARTQNVFGSAEWTLWRRTANLWMLTGTPVVNSAADMFPAFAGPLSASAGWTPPTYEQFCYEFTELKPDERGLVVETLVGAKVIALVANLVRVAWQNGAVRDYPIWAAERGVRVGDTDIRIKCKPVGERNPEKLRALLAPYMLRRVGGAGLPPLRIVPFPLPLADRDLQPVLVALREIPRERVVQALNYTLDLDTSTAEVDEQISRVRHALGLAKAAAAAEYIKFLLSAGAGPLVVFYNHQTVRERIITSLGEHVPKAWIDGGTHNPADVVAAFQDGRIQVLLVQIKAGGTGITLTRASRCMVVEPPWTAVALWQAVKRLHRIGQTKPVLAEILYASDCWLDEIIASAIATKAMAAKAVLGDPE